MTRPRGQTRSSTRPAQTGMGLALIGTRLRQTIYIRTHFFYFFFNLNYEVRDKYQHGTQNKLFIVIGMDNGANKQPSYGGEPHEIDDQCYRVVISMTVLLELLIIWILYKLGFQNYLISSGDSGDHHENRFYPT